MDFQADGEFVSQSLENLGDSLQEYSKNFRFIVFTCANEATIRFVEFVEHIGESLKEIFLTISRYVNEVFVPLLEQVDWYIKHHTGLDLKSYHLHYRDPNLWSGVVFALLVVLIMRSCSRQCIGFWRRDKRLSSNAYNKGEYDNDPSSANKRGSLGNFDSLDSLTSTRLSRNKSFPSVQSASSLQIGDELSNASRWGEDSEDSEDESNVNGKCFDSGNSDSGSDEGLSFSTIRDKFNRETWLKMAKNVLRKKKDVKGGPRMRVREVPASFLEAGWEDTDDRSGSLQSEVLVILKTCRVFGYFDNPVILELVKHVQTISLYKGENLFKIGDADDSIYVVSSGEIQLMTKDADTDAYTVMDVVQAGGSVSSLISILQVMAGQTSFFRSVEARAITPATVLRVPMTDARPIFEKFPLAIPKIASMILVRLQRVTLLILYNYLGLTHELFVPITTTHNVSSVPSTRFRNHTNLSKQQQSSGSAGQHRYRYGASEVKGFAHFRNGSRSVKHVNAGSCVTANADMDRCQSPHKWSTNSTPLLNDLKEGQNVADLISEGVEVLASMFNLDKDLVNKLIEHDIVEANTVLVEQGQPHLECHLYYVISGQLEASLSPPIGNRNHNPDQRLEHVVMLAQSGQTIGEMSLVTSMPSFYTIATGDEPVRVLKISVSSFDQLVKENPKSMLLFALHGVSRVSPLVRRCDFGMDWNQVEAGKLVYKQGSEATALYIVLNGRVRSVVANRVGGRKTLVTEFGRGESVGEIELLTATPRATSVHAIRDTELAKLPGELFEMIRQQYPEVSNAFTRKLGERLLGAMELPRAPTVLAYQQEEERMSTNKNLSTVAVVAVSNDVPLGLFCARLTAALTTIGSCLHLTRSTVQETLGPEAFNSVHEYKLISWLGEQEEHHGIVLYETDKKSSAWTKRCVRQADCILIVGMGDNAPTVGAVEKDLESITNRAQKELVLLHSFRRKPSRTVEWLNLRDWCTAHHHLRCSRSFLHGIAPASSTSPHIHSDFSRLARRLTNTSVGVVLGGGGARGLSHIGILRAIREADIPVDMVGGTSIGSLIGGLYCEETEWEKVWERGLVWSFMMASLWSKIMDLTYPITAMFSGSSFNTAIHKLFEERQIEDLWLPYFCVSTDLTDSKMKIHRHGTLWRYVRASMTLAGYLPPLCDPDDGHLLVDGGYVNNLPADIMREMGASSIIAIDVSSKEEKDLTNYGDSLSGWWLLWKRWNPFATPVNVPDMAEIQSRLAYVSCVRQYESVLDKAYINLVRPPIDVYSTLQFGSFHEIVDVGYNHAMLIINGTNWKQIHPDSTMDEDNSLPVVAKLDTGVSCAKAAKTRRSDSERMRKRITQSKIISTKTNNAYIFGHNHGR
eukprot:CFRG1612T1